MEKKFLDYEGLRYFLIMFKIYMNPNYELTDDEKKFMKEYTGEAF